MKKMNKAKKVQGLNKYIGLMFKTKTTAPLIFEFDKDVLIPIHSYFVFFKFKAIWYDKDGNRIEERIVKPFTSSVKPSKPFRKLVEIPLE